MAADSNAQALLERDWRGSGAAPVFQLLAALGGPMQPPIETFSPEETAFYGSSVAEGICPALHEEDADQHDRVARRLIPGRGQDGTWAECEECGALWRLTRGE